MEKCKVCGKEFLNLKALSSHIRQSHKTSSEEYYRNYLMKPSDGVCLTCGKPTMFHKLGDGFHKFCSIKCVANYPEHVESNRERMSTPERKRKSAEDITIYNKSQKGRDTSSANGKVWGSISFRKAHSKYDGMRYCEICGKETFHIIGVGCITCLNRSEQPKSRVVRTRIENQKISSLEKYFKNKLDDLNIQYIQEYKDSLYPYFCDFYLPEYNMYVELNGHFVHQKHLFNENNLDDVVTLSKYNVLAKTSSFYAKVVHIWTVVDVEKYKVAKENNLNYVLLWSIDDINKFLEDF